jgi:hypothetical protein
VSMVAFIISVITAFLFMYFSIYLTSSDKALVYFIVLIPLAIACALMLFKVMKSYATYKGTYQFHTTALSGPVVLFVIVMAGGFYFYQHPPAMDYNLVVKFIVQNDKTQRVNGKVKVAHKNDEPTYEVIDGRAMVPDVSPGEDLQFLPMLSGDYKSLDTVYKAPANGKPLTVELFLDEGNTIRKKELFQRFRQLLNAYLISANNFIQLMDDGRIVTVILGDSVAYEQYTNTILSYNKAWDQLTIIKDNFITELKAYQAFKNVDLDAFFDIFEKAHNQMFRSYNYEFDKQVNDFFQAPVAPKRYLLDALARDMKKHVNAHRAIFNDFLDEAKELMIKLE